MLVVEEVAAAAAAAAATTTHRRNIFFFFTFYMGTVCASLLHYIVAVGIAKEVLELHSAHTIHRDTHTHTVLRAHTPSISTTTATQRHNDDMEFFPCKFLYVLLANDISPLEPRDAQYVRIT